MQAKWGKNLINIRYITVLIVDIKGINITTFDRFKTLGQYLASVEGAIYSIAC